MSINLLTKKLETLYSNKNFTIYTGSNSFSLFTSSFYKTKINFYHYDNCYYSETILKIDFFSLKIDNARFSIDYFLNLFLPLSFNFLKSLWFEDSLKFIFFNITKKYVLNLISFFVNNYKFRYKLKKVLTLNFKRKRFFPLIRNLQGTTFFNTSLGILAKYLQKGKFFTKKKNCFLVSRWFN